MIESFTNFPEKDKESIPREYEVHEAFLKLLEGRKLTERRKLEDSSGLYLWEVSFEDEKGSVEYSYQREGNFKEGSSVKASIEVTFFDKSGFPKGGNTVAIYEDGIFRFVE